MFDVLTCLAGYSVDPDLVHTIAKELPVLCVHDRLDRSTEDLNVIVPKDPFLIEGNTTVEGSLSTEGEHNAIGALLLDHSLNEVRSDGEEVDRISDPLRRLYCSDIGVDEDGMDSLFLESLQGLRSGVIKLARLADLEGTGPEEEDLLVFLYVHEFRSLIKSSKKNSVSIGPPWHSGWNWTAKYLPDSWMIPSLEPSLRFSK